MSWARRWRAELSTGGEIVSTDGRGKPPRPRSAEFDEGMTLTATRPDVVPCPVVLIPSTAGTHLDRVARTGEIVRIARAMYAPAAAWAALAPWERYLARVHAAALRYPEAVFARESAAVLRGLPIFGEPRLIHLVAPGSETTRMIDDVRLHSAERVPEHEMVGGLLVATPKEIAADAARLQHAAVGLAVTGAALRLHGDLTVAQVQTLSETHPSSRGRRRARWVFERATATPESPLENVSLAVIEWCGFPPPELQVWVCGDGAEQDHRMDFAWPQWRIGGEADGDIKYSGAFGDARQALRERAARDARLIRRGVTTVRHWGWRDILEPDLLRSILLSAGLPLVRPPDHAALATLPRALRGH